MKLVTRMSKLPLVLGIIAALALPSIGVAGEDFGVVQGTVVDSNGKPIADAFVSVTGASPMLPTRMAYTDRSGRFFIPNLRIGDYAVKVTMPRFHPSAPEKIRVVAGSTFTMTVNLLTTADVIRRAKSPDADIVWTLRSSRSTQPILRHNDKRQPEITFSSLSWPNYSGHFQLYSKSVETTSGPADSVGSQFSLTMPFQANSKVTFAGQYNELPGQPRGLSAGYEFAPAKGRRARAGLNMRQSGLLVDSMREHLLREVQLEYSEQFDWTKHIALEYGAQVGRADDIASHNYIRPRVGVSWVPDARTMIGVAATSQPPSSPDDPIRGKNYFEQVYVPPALERRLHTEITLSRVVADDTKLSLTLFEDKAENQAMFVQTPDGQRGLLIVDARNMPSQGFRVHVNRDFGGVDAGLGYTTAYGIGLADSPKTVDEVLSHLERQRFHVVTARVKTEVDLTSTELTAVYRWMSRFAAAPLDPYQAVVEYNEPTLSITVAQDLPTWGTFPGRVQAIVDARNIFEHTFSSEKAQVTPSPRFVKGGINIRF